MAARTGVVEDLMNPQHSQSLPAGEPVAAPITEPLENDDWVDVEPEEAPPILKSSPNRHLSEWQTKYAELYFPLLFARYAPPPSPDCPSCKQACDTFYKCRTCLPSSPCCGQCLKDRHRHSPTHFVERFNGEFWEATSLAELGLVLHLGHDGEACPQSNTTVSVSQLLTAGLMACSDQLPQSAFTLAMLDHLSAFTTAGKCSSFKYWTVLKRLTNAGFPGRVSDRYRELLQTLRKYNYLISRKRCGVAFQPHPLENDPSDEGISCVACPRPTYNFNESEVSDETELEYFRFWASYDGNFRNPQKDKKVDPDDISLTKGKAYFVTDEDYKKFLDDLQARGIRS
ncbi:hypothetical protein FRC07_010675, partial [Ceratobasidium sp. 392]